MCRYTTGVWKTLLMAGMMGLIPMDFARGVEVKRAEWGFNQNATLGEFNQLLIYVHNETREPFRGRFSLQKELALSLVDARIVSEEVFLPPESGRWITFYPYITSNHQDWVVTWGRGRSQRHTIDAPPLNDGEVIYLWVDEVDRPPEGLIAFEADKFPTNVAVTRGLYAVVMDRVPEWDAARRRAFRDWLYLGGRLHLLENPGVPMRFTEELVELNNPNGEFRIGAGRVTRVPLPRSAITRELVMGWGPPEVPQKDEPFNQFGYSNLESSIFNELRSGVTPRHNWNLIYGATALFLLLVGPVNWWLSRRRVVNYRGSLGILCVAIGLFGFGFFKIGQAGYGEEAVVDKFAYARSLGDSWDVTQFVNIFVTSGDRYTIQHEMGQNLYATAQEYEGVRGVLRQGTGESMSLEVEIPIYSSRPFVHHGRLAQNPFQMGVQSWPVESEGFEGLVLRVGDGFPTEIEDVWAIRGDKMTPLLRRTAENRFVPSVNAGLEHKTVMASRVKQRQTELTSFSGPPIDPVSELLESKLVTPNQKRNQPITEPDRVIVLVLAPAPQELAMPPGSFGIERGTVLYRIDVFRDQTINEEKGATP